MARPIRISGTAKGMVYMLGSTIALTSMVTVVRHISLELDALVVAFYRSFFGLLVFTPLFLRRGFAPLRTRRLGLHALRGTIQGAAMVTAFVGYALTEELAKALALDFTAPLFATPFAFLILRERIRMRRITALLAGFLGTLIIVRPGFIALDPGAVALLVSAACWGVALVIIKMLSRTESSMTSTIYSTIFTTPVAFAAAMFVWEWPSWTQFYWLVVIGGLGSLGHVLLVQSFKEADATAVMPLNFLKMIWAAVLGYLIFDEVPDAWTWAGAVVIFASTTYIAYRESRVRRYGHGPRLKRERGGKLELED